MYLHLGQETVIRDKEIIGVFDIEKTSVSKVSKQFLANASKKDKVITVSYEMPKSFVVTQKDKKTTIYISQISSTTLKKRADKRKNK
ncbi:MAG: DUF370 domain-containing protein [Oscillospiraceae bacterium]